MSDPLQLARDALAAMMGDSRRTYGQKSAWGRFCVPTDSALDMAEAALAALDAAIAQRGEPAGPTDEQIEHALEQWFCADGTFQDRMRAAVACVTAPPARVPLTDSAILDEFRRQAVERRSTGKPSDPGFGDGVRFAERAHGITGA